MSDILDEVLLEQSEVKKIKLLKDLLPYIISVSLLMAVSLFIYNWWQNKQKAINMRIGDVLIQTINKDSNKENDFAILKDIIKNNNGKIADLANLKQIEIKILAGLDTEAKALLESIINNTAYDKVTSAYARILWLSMMLDKDTLSDTDKNFQEVIFKYFYDDKQPFWGIANILKALYAVKTKQNDNAQTILKALVDNKTISNGIKDIAQIILFNLSNKGEI